MQPASPPSSYVGVLAVRISSLQLTPTLLFAAHWPWSVKMHISGSPKCWLSSPLLH